jgi:hypothetical protein
MGQHVPAKDSLASRSVGGPMGQPNSTNGASACCCNSRDERGFHLGCRHMSLGSSLRSAGGSRRRRSSGECRSSRAVLGGLWSVRAPPLLRLRGRFGRPRRPRRRGRRVLGPVRWRLGPCWRRWLLRWCLAGRDPTWIGLRRLVECCPCVRRGRILRQHCRYVGPAGVTFSPTT